MARVSRKAGVEPVDAAKLVSLRVNVT